MSEKRESESLFKEPLPKAGNPWRELFTYQALGRRWPGAGRAALALGIPGSISLALGYDNAMLLVAAGAFTVISGEGHPFRHRWKLMAVIGLLLVGGTTTGSFIGQAVRSQIAETGSEWWLLVFALFPSLVAAGLTFAQNSLRMRPPGMFFVVMVTASSQMSSAIGLKPLEVGMWASIGAVSGWLLGMAPALLDAHQPEREAIEQLEQAVARYQKAPGPAIAERHAASAALTAAWEALDDARIIRGGHIINRRQSGLVTRALNSQNRLASLNEGVVDVTGGTATENLSPADLSRVAIPHGRPTAPYMIYRSIHPHSHSTLAARQVFLASILSGVISVLLGWGRPDWAIVTVVLVLQWGPDKIPGSIRAVHRMLGSIAGIALYSLIHAFQPDTWVLLLILVVCQFYAEVFIVRNYALTVIFTTPLALLMGGGIDRPLAATATFRILEVAIAVAIAIALLWLARPKTHELHHARLLDRCFNAMGDLIGALTILPPSQCLARRRDLQFELVGERRAIISLSKDHHTRAKAVWRSHLMVQKVGYDILDVATTRGDQPLTIAEIDKLALRVRAAYLHNDQFRCER